MSLLPWRGCPMCGAPHKMMCSCPPCYVIPAEVCEYGFDHTKENCKHHGHMVPMKEQHPIHERLKTLPDERIQHVYPTFGCRREHITNQREGCWCGPTVEFVDGGAIIIHEVEQ